MKYRLTCLVLLLSLIGCGNRGLDTRLDEAEARMMTEPDSSFAILSRLPVHFLSPGQRARHSLLTAMAIDKQFIDTTDEAVILPAVHYYEKHGAARRRLQALYYDGRIQANAGRNYDAILSFTKALEGKEEAGLREVGLLYSALADVFQSTDNVMEEASNVDKALACYIELGEPYLIQVGLYRKAVSLTNRLQFQEAIPLYDSLYRMPDLNPRVRQQLLPQYAFVLASEDQDALNPKAFQIFSECLQEGIPLEPKMAGGYAYVLKRLGYPKEAEALFRYLDSLEGVTPSQLLGWKAMANARNRDYKTAYRLLDSLMQCQNSFVLEKLSQPLSALQRDYFQQVAETEKLKAERQTHLTWLVIAISLLGFILVSAGIVLLLARKRKKEAEMEGLVEVLRKGWADQIQSLQNRIRQVSGSHFKAWADLYERYDIKRRNGAPDEELYQEALSFVNTLKADFSSRNVFEQLINETQDNILVRFREDYPHMKELNIRLFAYYVAGFDTKTISILLGNHSADSLYMRKKRLKDFIQASDSPHKAEYLAFL